MALIKCPECGKEFSEFAKSCPNCGCPTNIAKKGLKPKKQTSHSPLSFSFCFNGEKSFMDFDPNNLEVHFVGANNKRDTFVADGILSINADKFFLDSEIYKNSAFKKAFKSGLIAATFGMGLIVDTRGYKSDVEIVKTISLCISSNLKDYYFNISSVPFVANDDLFKDLTNSIKEIENAITKINKVISNVLDERIQEDIIHAINSKKVGDVYVYSNSHDNLPHYFSKNPTKAQFEKLLNESFKKGGCFGVYNMGKKNTLLYDSEVLYFDLYSNKKYIQFSKEPISDKKAIEYMYEMFEKGVINPKGFENEDSVEETEVEEGFGSYNDIGPEFIAYLKNPTSYIPTKIGEFSIKYYVRERSTQKETIIFKQMDCNVDVLTQVVNTMFKDLKSNKYQSKSGTTTDLGIDLIINDSLVKLSYCTYYPGFIYSDGKNVFATTHKVKLTDEYVLQTFKYLLINKSLPLFKGWKKQ